MKDIVPMKFGWYEGHLEPTLLTGWVGQQKMDGMRCMARIEEGSRTEFVTFGGAPLVQSAAAQHFPAIRTALAGLRGWVLDGEIMPDQGIFWVFDVPLSPRSGPDDLLITRLSVLDELDILLGDAGPVRVLPTVWAPRGIVELHETTVEARAEGIVIKRLDAPYECGQRVNTVLKVKNHQTVDAVVLARNTNGATNATLGLVKDGQMVVIGSCTMIGKQGEVGQVVEVRYLSWRTGGALVQPRVVQVRTDKAPADCLFDQLVPATREVIRSPWAGTVTDLRS